ncbi:Pathogen-related protein [Thalictrum thalictroides]|uniref:Pathogen-related protein n=1 Tax=Thalictrum thalictroides TaxID=46969 RepID=A0A7J6UW54_THATH|nr:Pathogen-related protein [Thalictrum thalictroides]
MASSDVTTGADVHVPSDPYRSFIDGKGEKDTVWRNGAPPNYEVVNKLFEQGRTHVWALGTPEEKVQRLLKTWEMELVHKVRPQDYKLIDAQAFSHSVNGTPGKTLAEVQLIGSYNQFLQTSLPEELRAYDPSKYTLEEAQNTFLNAFPRGFAVEILEVYSGPPKVAYKFRHFSTFDGPFQGHAPTHELVQLIGISIFTVDESTNKVGAVEFFYDPGELIGDLLKGPLLDGSEAPKKSGSVSGCPVLSKLHI